MKQKKCDICKATGLYIIPPSSIRSVPFHRLGPPSHSWPSPPQQLHHRRPFLDSTWSEHIFQHNNIIVFLYLVLPGRLSTWPGTSTFLASRPPEANRLLCNSLLYYHHHQRLLLLLLLVMRLPGSPVVMYITPATAHLLAFFQIHSHHHHITSTPALLNFQGQIYILQQQSSSPNYYFRNYGYESW